MAQYSSAKTNTTVSVTKNSATIIGNGTAWSNEIKVGDAFTVKATNVVYDIAEVVSDTEITLSSPYRGNTNLQAQYTIHRDFTVPDNIPELTNGDIETGTIMKRLARRIQSKFNELTGLNFTGQWEEGVEYKKLDIVSIINSSGDPELYLSSQEHTSNQTNKPPNDDFWSSLFSAQDVDTIVFGEMNWRGPWAPDTQYFEQNVVRYNESIYVATANDWVSGQTFDDTKWEYLINIDELKQYKEDAEAAKELAEKWASNPKNAEVLNGLFSARHYAEVAKDFASSENSLYVSTAGSDYNDGKTPGTALRSIERACNVARSNPNLSVVKVYPGTYYEDGEIEVPPNTAVVSEGGQFVTDIHTTPGNEEVNMFLANSGSYIQGFGFRGLRLDSLENPTKGFAVAFAPNALIVRSPYVRDSSQVSNFTPENIAAPVDPANGNPLVGNGGGVLLADRSVLNPNSIYPYMLAFGATPRTPNGIGYCAKNGAGINGISSITIFSRISFLAINGGQVTLNNSGTQFGDISMKATGTLPVVNPTDPGNSDVIITNLIADEINDNKDALVDDMWNALVSEGYTDNWPSFDKQKVYAPDSTNDLSTYPTSAQAIDSNLTSMVDSIWNKFINYIDNGYVDWTSGTYESQTKRDAKWLLTAIRRDLQTGTDQTTKDFVKNLYDASGNYVFDPNLLFGFEYSYDIIQQELESVISDPDDINSIRELISIVRKTLRNPNTGTYTQIFAPSAPSADLAEYPSDSDAIEANLQTIIDNVWNTFTANVDTECSSDGITWSNYETEVKRDTEWLVTALSRDLINGTDHTAKMFAEGLYSDTDATPVYDTAMQCGFLYSYDVIETEVTSFTSTSSNTMVGSLIQLIKDVVSNPTNFESSATIVPEQSSITINKTSNAVGIIDNNISSIQTTMWQAILDNINDPCPSSSIDWTQYETLTKRDSEWLLTSISRDLVNGDAHTAKMFVEGLFTEDDAVAHYDLAMTCAFLFSYKVIQNEIKGFVNSDSWNMIEGLIDIVEQVVNDPDSFKDSRNVLAKGSTVEIAESSQAVSEIDSVDIDTMVNDVWNTFVNFGIDQCPDNIDWTGVSNYETFTKRDAKSLITAIRRDLQVGVTQTTRDFVEGLFDRNGDYVFDTQMFCAFFFTYMDIENRLKDLISGTNDKESVEKLINIVKDTLNFPEYTILNREELTRRDAYNLLRAIEFDLRAGTRNSTKGFVLGLFNWNGDYIFPSQILDSFTFAHSFLRNQILGNVQATATQDERNALIELFGIVSQTLNNPDKLNFGSLIESLGHQFNNAGAGVNKNALPLNFRRAGQNRTVPFTVIQEDGGRVRWSGSDELNNQYLAGGTKINGLTGRIEGKPFDAAVRQIARRIANTRSGF